MHTKTWYLYFQLTACYEKRGKKKEKCEEDGRGRWMRNKIWRGGWYLGWDGNISLLFSSVLSRAVYLSLPPLLPSTSSWDRLGAGPAGVPGGPLRSPAQRWRDGAFMPCTTSRSMGLFWQGRQQWMGIITVSLQELAEMKAVFNVQKSPGNYLKAREREREWEERDRREGEINFNRKQEGWLFRYYIWRDQSWSPGLPSGKEFPERHILFITAPVSECLYEMQQAFNSDGNTSMAILDAHGEAHAPPSVIERGAKSSEGSRWGESASWHAGLPPRTLEFLIHVKAKVKPFPKPNQITFYAWTQANWVRFTTLTASKRLFLNHCFLERDQEVLVSKPSQLQAFHNFNHMSERMTWARHVEKSRAPLVMYFINV